MCIRTVRTIASELGHRDEYVSKWISFQQYGFPKATVELLDAVWRVVCELLQLGAGLPPLEFGLPPLEFGLPPLEFGLPPLEFGLPRDLQPLRLLRPKVSLYFKRL